MNATSSSLTQLDGVNSESRLLSIVGSAVSVAVALAVCGALLLVVGRAGAGCGFGAAPAPSSSSAAAATAEAALAWKERAARGLPLLVVGACLQLLGAVTAAASLIVPWVSAGLSSNSAMSTALRPGSATATFSVYVIASATTLSFAVCDSATDALTLCVRAAAPNPAMASVAGWLFFAIAAFSLPSCLLAARASVLLKRVVSLGVMPPTTCACLLGMSTIMALAWVAFTAHLIAGAVLGGTFALVVSLLGATTNNVGAGPFLLAASLVATFVGTVLYSVAGCCRVANLPGVGRSHRSCLLTETADNARPGGVISAAATGAPFAVYGGAAGGGAGAMPFPAAAAAAPAAPGSTTVYVPQPGFPAGFYQPAVASVHPHAHGSGGGVTDGDAGRLQHAGAMALHARDARAFGAAVGFGAVSGAVAVAHAAPAAVAAVAPLAMAGAAAAGRAAFGALGGAMAALSSAAGHPQHQPHQQQPAVAYVVHPQPQQLVPQAQVVWQQQTR